MGRLKVELLPILNDNYVFFLVDTETSQCVIVDPGDEGPVLEFIRRNELKPVALLLTHHHADHIDGAAALLNRFAIPAYASSLESKKMGGLQTKILHTSSSLEIGPFQFQVLELPGHTLGHIAFYEENKHWLFSGDVLFGLGCGRVFEGTYQQMYETLQKVKVLPEDTLVFCTHEYTEANLNFCKRLTPFDGLPLVGDDEDLEIYENQLQNLRSVGRPSVPLKLGIEKRVNPFLLAKNVEIFSQLRELRNKA